MDNMNNQGGSQEPQRSGYPSRESGESGPGGSGYTPPPSGQPTGSETRRMDTPPSAYSAPGGQPYPYNQYNPLQPAPYSNQPAPPPEPSAYSGSTYQPPTQQPTPYSGQSYQYNQPQQYVAPGAYNPQPPVYGRGGGNFPDNAIVKDPTVAVLIEIIVGLFGFLGVGHMLAGRWIPGVILLVGGLVLIPTVFFLFTVLTCGIGLCLLPLWPLVPILSGLWLRSELLGRPIFSR